MSSYSYSSACLRKESGVTLIVALVFLLSLSMLGIWSASNNALEERMAGNQRQRDLAFQAAESALEDAEITIEEWRLRPFNGNGGLFMQGAVNERGQVEATQANNAAFWRDLAFWGTSMARPAMTVTLQQVARRPEYIVEKMTAQGDIEYYRITARGVGGDTAAVVILQSIITFQNS